MQRALDARISESFAIDSIDPDTATLKELREWTERTAEMRSKREGLHEAWVVLQEAAQAIKRQRDGELVICTLGELMDR